jgi:hypothetical protein
MLIEADVEPANAASTRPFARQAVYDNKVRARLELRRGQCRNACPVRMPCFQRRSVGAQKIDGRLPRCADESGISGQKTAFAATAISISVGSTSVKVKN